jgi:hypothetical protein
MLEHAPAGRFISQPHYVMPEQTTEQQIARKVNFAIQLLRETAELLEASKPTPPQRPRYYPRRSKEHAE